MIGDRKTHTGKWSVIAACAPAGAVTLLLLPLYTSNHIAPDDMTPLLYMSVFGWPAVFLGGLVGLVLALYALVHTRGEQGRVGIVMSLTVLLAFVGLATYLVLS